MGTSNPLYQPANKIEEINDLREKRRKISDCKGRRDRTEDLRVRGLHRAVMEEYADELV